MNLKNWKTSATGIGIGAAKIGYELYKTGNLTVDNLVTAVGIALVGLIAKDFNVSGGTINQNPPVEQPK